MLRKLLLLLAFAPAVSLPAWATTEESVSGNVLERVAFAAQHDPAVIKLTSDERFSVLYAEGMWDRVDQWSPGRPLKLIYDPAKGGGLQDEKTEDFLLLTAWPNDRHPLDIELTTALENAGDTVGIVDAYSTVIPKWKVEIKRAYGLLASLPELSPEGRDKLSTAEAAWWQFHDAQTNTLWVILLQREGTIWRIEAAGAHLQLLRDHARQLFGLLD